MSTKEQLLALEVGQNCAVYVRIGPPVGPVTLPEGREGELITLDGEHIAWMVPGTVKHVEGSGFGRTKTNRYYFRAVIADEERSVLVSGQVNTVVGLANVKRMVDRENPTDREAPRARYGQVRRRKAWRETATDYDLQDTEEL